MERRGRDRGREGERGREKEREGERETYPGVSQSWVHNYREASSVCRDAVPTAT